MDFNNNLDNSPPNTGASHRSSTLFSHIIAEVVVVGGLSLYLYNKITRLENVVETLKTELEETKNLFHLNHPSAKEQERLRRNVTSVNSLSPRVTRITGTPRENFAQQDYSVNIPSSAMIGEEYIRPRPRSTDARYVGHEHVEGSVHSTFSETEQDCEGGVCKLKRVAISKVSTQREIDGNTSKVQTFTTKSPNPVLKSVTPSLSAEPENGLDKVLNDIDDE